MVDTPSPSIQDSLNSLNTRMELNMVEVLAKSYGEGFVKAVEGMEAKPQIKKDDSRLLKEDVARMTRPIQDYNKALAGKVDEIVRDSFAAGKDDMEVARILRARIPEILNNEPITIQRPGKRPVSFTADEYADIVANVVPYAVRNEGYIRGLKEAGADGWQWVAVGDERMCPMCGAKHGQIYGWDDAKPPGHPGCRCRPIAYFRKRTKEEIIESERIKAWAEEKPWETPGTPAESPDEVAEALIDDIIPKKMAYPGSKIERPKLERKTIDLHNSPVIQKATVDEIAYMNGASSSGVIEKGDSKLKALAEEIGFSDMPTIVSESELDKIVAEGHRELWRGLNQNKPGEFTNLFRSGEYFAGEGIYGNGIYTGTGEGARNLAALYAPGEHGAVMRMAIDKDAKVITVTELKEKLDAELKSLKFDRSSEEAWAASKVKKEFMQDPGRAAVVWGYDAIDVENGQFIVLNRKAIYVQATDYTREDRSKW